MKFFIPLLYVTSVLAEPPVGDGYPEARSSHDQLHDDRHVHHAPENQRSLSQEYGPSADFASSRSLSTEYSVPKTRIASNSRGQNYAPPAARVRFNHRFRSAASRSTSQEQSPAVKAHSQNYGVSDAPSGISQKYGPPNARSLSQEYGIPFDVSAKPNAESSPSEQYSTSVIAARSSQNRQSHPSRFRSSQRTKAPSHDFSSPSTRSQFSTSSLPQSHTAPLIGSNEISQGYDSPKPFARSSFGSQSLSQTYGAPKNAPTSTYDALSLQSLSSSYGVSSAKSSDSKGYDSVSQSYDVSSRRDLSDTYGVSSSRGQFKEYGTPSSRTNLKTNVIASSYSPARSSPSSTYLSTGPDGTPLDLYGELEQRDSSQGYDYARARALDELLNQEPANYEFTYQVADQESGSEFGHTESREENRAEGSYFVVLPDGTKETVEYEADEGGFKPRISLEAADESERTGGYDDNAAEIRSEGPY